jgi:Flp pilus assembly protein TadG
MGWFIIINKAKIFMRNCGGNFSLFFALLSPVLFGLVGGAVDLIVYERQQAQMQDVLDAAALAAAREASLKGWNQATAEAVVQAMISGNLEGKTFSAETKFNTVVIVDEPSRTVNVTLDMDQFSFFVLGYFRHDPQIRVRSSATSSNNTNVCVIGLDDAAAGTIAITDSAKVNAADCAVFSNSSATDGLSSLDSGLLTSQFACSSGGYEGMSGNYSSKPTTDCPKLADPLAERIPPVAGSCDETNLVLSDQTISLNPGTYCGGINIKKYVNVTFKPGIYIIKDGPLLTKNQSVASGNGVTFYFTGAGARFSFDGTTEISFKAPENGPTAGLLFFQDPAAPAGTIFQIDSKKAANLLGTIYLPNGTLSIRAKNKVAEASAYTVIVARKIKVGVTTEMHINANYGATAVPVPTGLGPQTGKVRLLN